MNVTEVRGMARKREIPRIGYTRRLASVALLIPATAFAQVTSPTVPFNFRPHPDAIPQGNFAYVACNMPGVPDWMCSPATGAGYGNADPSQTPFLQETVSLNGQTYFHVIIGQPNEGFAQETYIRAGGRRGFMAFSDSGGNACIALNGRSVPPDYYLPMARACSLDNNSRNPLGPFDQSANASGNPNAVLMRQIVSDADRQVVQEFLKADLSQKPKISQTFSAPGIEGTFAIDMSNSDYNTDDTPGKVSMTQSVAVSDLPGASGNITFNIDEVATAAPNVSGGRYTYTPNTALAGITATDSDGNLIYDTRWRYGTYTNWLGNVDPIHEVDWAAFRDPSQNQGPGSNPGQGQNQNP